MLFFLLSHTRQMAHANSAIKDNVEYFGSIHNNFIFLVML